MKNKIKISLTIVCLLAVLAVLTACTELSTVDSYKEQGMIISVKYEANGGEYLGRDGVTLMDMFDPQNYTADADGEIHIKLLEPTNPSRPTGGSDKVYLTKPGYSCIGWYRERTVKTDSEGRPLDYEGNVLYEKDGRYYMSESYESEGEPAYNYSGYWDFSEDTLDYVQASGEEYEMTLYAGWIKYFTFEYYTEVGGEWTKLESDTVFDYVSTNRENSSTHDRDTVWLPTWPEGAATVEYAHKYSDGNTYTFPKIDGTTFAGAYTDPECTKPIDGELTHPGQVDYETAAVSNAVQKIYIKTTEGEQYKITTAEQLVSNANTKGHYEIMADLDFTGLEWPKMFMNNAFTGRIYTAEGKTYTLSNINAVYSSTNAKNGGLFGSIAKNASVKGIKLDNVTLDVMQLVPAKMASVNFGVISGSIESGADVAVTLGKATLRLGVVNFGNDYSLNLVANGDISGVTVEEKVGLVIYGEDYLEYFNYSLDPAGVKVYKNYNVVLSAKTVHDKEKSEHVIDYTYAD